MAYENKITTSDLFSKGIGIIHQYDRFTLISDSYADDIKKYSEYIKGCGYIVESTKLEGKDSEVLITIFRKLTQSELDAANLELQISLLEKRFNIKISYVEL